MAATFVPYPFRPFWQPNCPSPPPSRHHDIGQFERLIQKVDKAEQKIDEYLRLIASLSAEVKRYQDLICYTCKEKVIRATLAVASPTSSQSIALPTFLSGPSTILASPDPSSACTTPGTMGPASVQVVAKPSLTITSSSGVHDQSSDNPDSSLATTPSSDTVPHLPTSTTPAISPYSAGAHSDSEQSQPAVPSISETAIEDGPITQPEPDHSDWSVEHNPEIERQCLSLHLADTFTYSAKVFCAKFSHDGKYLAVGLDNGETHIYDMTTGSKTVLAERSATVFYIEAAKPPSKIWVVQFSLDNKFVATAGTLGLVNVWEIGRRRIRATFKHTGVVSSLDLSPDGRFLVSASFDGSVCVWCIRDGSSRRLLHQSLQFLSVAFSPDGRYVAAGNEDGCVRICDVRTGQLVVKRKIGDRGRVNLRSVKFTSDGQQLATGARTVKCWDVSSLRGSHSERQMMQDDAEGQMKQIWGFNGQRGSITALSFSSDTRWILSSSLDDSVHILDARSGNWLCALKPHISGVWGGDFSPAGDYIVSGGEGRVRLWRYEMVE